MAPTASIDTIGLGRGGLCVSSTQPLNRSTLAFQVLLARPGIALVGQGYVRWCSRTESKVGIEIAYLDPACIDWLAEEITRQSPRSFIPGT